MNGSLSQKRQRADGTWTYTTEAWDARWYWPVGTRVRFKAMAPIPKALHGVVGTVVRENAVSVSIRTDANVAWGSYSDRTLSRVSFEALERL